MILNFERRDLVSKQLILLIEFVIISREMVDSELERFKSWVNLFDHVIFVLFVSSHFIEVLFSLSFIVSHNLLLLKCQILYFCAHVSEGELKLRFKLRKLFSLCLNLLYFCFYLLVLETVMFKFLPLQFDVFLFYWS